MKVAVAYALPHRQVWLRVELAEGATVLDAIVGSGILDRFPGLDPAQHKVGVFGKVSPLDTPVHDGDRVEIYRALVADPKTVPKKTKAERGAAEPAQEAAP